MRCKTLTLTAAALALALTVQPATAQKKKSYPTKESQMRAASTGEAKVIAVQVWASPLDSRNREIDRQRFGLAPNNESVPVAPGERVRLEMAGTALFDGSGVGVPLHARFDVAAGNVRIVDSGPTWAVVDTGNRSNGSGVLGQIEYRLNGNYDAKAGLKSGRITLESSDRSVLPGSSNDVYDRDSARWRKAESLAALLYRGILDTTLDPRRDDDREAIEEIYRDGEAGVQNLAVDLARVADSRRDWRGNETQRVGDLYRDLLGRNLSDRQLLDQDSGFVGNVNRLRRDGLDDVVQIIVGSEEFRRVHDLSGFEALRGVAYQRDLLRDRIARERARDPYRD